MWRTAFAVVVTISLGLSATVVEPAGASDDSELRKMVREAGLVPYLEFQSRQRVFLSRGQHFSAREHPRVGWQGRRCKPLGHVVSALCERDAFSRGTAPTVSRRGSRGPRHKHS